MLASSQALRALALSIVLFITFILCWQALVIAGQGEAAQGLDPEYAALMGKQVTEGASALPTPAEVGALARGVFDHGGHALGVSQRFIDGVGNARQALGFADFVQVAAGMKVEQRQP